MPEPNALTVERVNDPAVLEALRETWNTLLATNATRTAELTYEWQMAYWKYSSRDSELFVLVVKDGPEVIGIASMRVVRRRVLGVRVRELRFIADKESNYQDFIIGRNRPAVLQAIANYLKAHHDQWDILYLARLSSKADTCAWFEQAFAGWGHSRVADVEKVVSLQTAGGWAAYAQATHKHRKHATRCKKRLERFGTVGQFRCATEAELVANLEVFFELHRSRWNGTQTPSQFNTGCVCDFYREVSPALFAKDQLDLHVITVADQPVAMAYSFRFDGVAVGQLETYDTAFQRGAPGIVCLESYVEWAFVAGVKTIEMGSYFPYKELWFNDAAFRKNVELYAADNLAARYVFALRRIANSSWVLPLTNQLKQARQWIKGKLWKLKYQDDGAVQVEGV